MIPTNQSTDKPEQRQDGFTCPKPQPPATPPASSDSQPK
nr:MAG TPA: hypothetical protein [Caudoviricetes sp.]